MQRSVLTSGNAQLQMTEPQINEVMTKYQPGELKARPKYFYGRPKSAIISAALQLGMFVIHGLTDVAPAIGDEGRAATFEKCPAGRRPDGYLEYREGEFLCVRMLEGDVSLAGITVGTEYVVGTDGKPAKAGDSTYPSTIATPYVVGVGWIAGALMLGAASRIGSSSLSARNLTASTAIIADSRTDFTTNIADIDLSKLPVGGRLVISGMIDALTAAAATTFTFYLKAVQAGAVADLDIFLPLALDGIDAGDNISYEVTLLKTSATEVMSWGRIGCKGDVTGKNHSGGGLKVATTLDMSVLTTFQPACSFSVAGANSAIHRAMFVDPR